MRARTFTMLSSSNDVAAMEAACPAALAGNVLTLDPDTHRLLDERGIRHLTPWDVVAADEGRKVKELEAAAIQYWQTVAVAEYRGHNLLTLAGHRHTACFARLAWMAYVARRGLEELQPQEVVVFEERAGHGLEQPPAHRETPLLQALLRGLAEQASVRTRVLKNEGAHAREFVDHVALSGAQHLPPIDPDAAIGRGGYLLFHANLSDIARQLPLIAALRRETTLPIVQLYTSADESMLQAARRVGHHVWHASQLPRGGRSQAGEYDSATARGAFDRARRNVPAELRGIFANRYMDIHFDFIFGHYMQRMAWHVDTWTKFFERNRPAMIVANYQAPIFDVAVALGIPGLFLPHGTVPRDPDWVLSAPPAWIGALSLTHARQLTGAGVPAERIVVTGDPALDPAVAHAAQWTATPADAGTQALRRHLGIAPQQKVIVLGTSDLGTPSKRTSHPHTNWAAAVHSVGELAGLVGRHPEWVFLLRCHPRYDHPALYARLQGALPPRGRLLPVTDQAPEEFLPIADAVVFLNTITSAIPEFSLWRKPVLLMLSGLIWGDPEQWLVCGWPRLGSVQELEHELTRMFGAARHYQRRVQQTADALRRFLDGPPTPAAPRCAALIRRIAEAAPDSTENGEPALAAACAGAHRSQPCQPYP